MLFFSHFLKRGSIGKRPVIPGRRDSANTHPLKKRWHQRFLSLIALPEVPHKINIREKTLHIKPERINIYWIHPGLEVTLTLPTEICVPLLRLPRPSLCSYHTTINTVFRILNVIQFMLNIKRDSICWIPAQPAMSTSNNANSAKTKWRSLGYINDILTSIDDGIHCVGKREYTREINLLILSSLVSVNTC
jgi:hypothetical protein